MTTDPMLAALILLGVWGLLLAWRHESFAPGDLLVSFMVLAVALLALLGFQDQVSAENQLAVVLGLLAVPCLVSAWLAARRARVGGDG